MPLAYSVAPASERALGASSFIASSLELAAILAALAFGAFSARALLLPGWRGAPARLVELVLAASALVIVSELIGVVGLYTEAAVVVALIAVGVAGGLVARAVAAGRPLSPAPTPPAPPSSRIAVAGAIVAVAALAAAWAVPTLTSAGGGMIRSDTLWYHMPLAARWAQTSHIGPIFFFDPIYFASFYPANSELFHGLGILVYGRDLVSPLVNDWWLAISLLAAWCIGRPYGVAPQAMIGAAVALGAGMLVGYEPGEALNDITGVAFTLAAAAILVNASAGAAAAGNPSAPLVASAPHAPPAPREARRERVRRPPLSAIVLAALATGLAAGVKLSYLPVAAVLTVGVIAVARPGMRGRTALAWLVPLAATGGFWYLRNLIVVGNPIPYIHRIGPVTLPGPVRDFSLRPGYSVSHYWNDTSVWSHWFFPGLHATLGLLWPVVLAGLVAVSLYTLARGGEPILRVLAAVTGVTAIAYLFTPLTAAGVEGQPIAFTWNLRYLAPALAVGFAVVPCLPPLRATPGRRMAVGAGLAVLVVFALGSLRQWHVGHLKGATAAGVIVLVLGVGLWLSASRLSRLRPIAWLGLAVAVAVAVVVAGYAYQRHYLDRRYADTGTGQDLNRTLAWVRDIRGARIALGGIRGVFTQYAFYGDALSNRVQWLGRRVADDGYARIGTCGAWRRAVNSGHFDVVITTFDPYLPGSLRNSPEGRWTESDPNARLILRQGPVRAFRIAGRLDPAGCRGQRPLSEAQLHGVPALNRKA